MRDKIVNWIFISKTFQNFWSTDLGNWILQGISDQCFSIFDNLVIIEQAGLENWHFDIMKPLESQ